MTNNRDHVQSVSVRPSCRYLEFYPGPLIKFGREHTGSGALSFIFETPTHLSSFPLDPPLDAPQRTPTHALVRLVRLTAKLKLVDLQRAEQRTGWQRERDLRRARGARVRIAARERAPQRRGTAWRRGGTGGTGGRRSRGGE
jgi:hypothetical protein